MIDEITRLPVVVIHAHTRCNCRCVMCDIWKTAENREFSVDVLRAQLPAFEKLGVQWVVFSGGEPLMNSQLFILAHMLRERGIRVSLLSTGLLFQRFATEIAEGIDDLIVSLDGPEPVHDEIRRVPGVFRMLLNGIKAIRQLRPGLPISARCTVQARNHRHLCETVETARHMGLNSISFLAADWETEAFGRGPADPIQGFALSPSEIDALEDQIKRLTGDPLVSDSPAHLRRILAHFRAHLGLQRAQAPRCNAPWVSAVIETDGRVRPCFFHPTLGNLGSGDLEAVVNGADALRFRGSLHIADNPVCRRCVCSLYVEQAPSSAVADTPDVKLD